MIYSFVVTDPSGQDAINFNANMGERVFTFSNMDKIALAGQNFTDYTVTVKADAGIVSKKHAEVDYNLKIRNPCVDPDYVKINK